VSGAKAILRCGAHVPRNSAWPARRSCKRWRGPIRRRGATARGARAVGNWDEDALTMAVEAARSCLEHAAGDRNEQPVPGSVLFCSTTAPFADRDDAVVLCAALDLAEQVENAEHRLLFARRQRAA